MKNKKYLWLAGWLCAIPLSLAAQQTEPLTGKERLFNDCLLYTSDAADEL